MPGILMSVIEIHAVGVQDLLHDLIQCFLHRLDQHMKVVCHQTASMDFKWITFSHPINMH